MRRSLCLAAAPPLAAVAVLLASPDANAGITIHVEQDVGILTSVDLEAGVGFSGRLGYRFDIGPLWLAPELGGGYLTFGDVDGQALHPSRMYGGGRVGLDGFVQPQLYVHAGYGWLGDLGDVSLEGALFEVGVAVDLRVLPVLGIGAHAGFTSNDNLHGGAQARDSFNWLSFGVHAGLTF